jgi:hypothetical protein
MLQTFAVVVPEGLHPGQQFRASLGGQLTLISVPQGTRGNDTIHVQIEVNGTPENVLSFNSTTNVYSVMIPRNISAGQSFPININGRITWIICPTNNISGDSITINVSAEQITPQNSNSTQNINAGNALKIIWPPPIEISSNFDTMDIPKHLLCPITECIMHQPAITPYGTTYDYSAIDKWLKLKQFDPTTNQPLTKNQLYPNRTVHYLIEEFISEQKNPQH